MCPQKIGINTWTINKYGCHDNILSIVREKTPFMYAEKWKTRPL